jgi:Ca2+-binding RTX toxin-like protein
MNNGLYLKLLRVVDALNADVETGAMIMTEYFNGTDGNDYYNYFGPDALIAYGKGGNDYIWGNNSNDFLMGDAGNDTLKGWYGDDWLYGGTGNDQLYGENGKDFLNGYGQYSSNEKDTLTGGADADVFGLGYNGSYTEIAYLGEGFATITDFNSQEGDQIRLGGSINNYSLDQTQNFGGSSSLDTAIYYSGNLIAVLQDTTNFALQSPYVLI